MDSTDRTPAERPACTAYAVATRDDGGYSAITVTPAAVTAGKAEPITVYYRHKSDADYEITVNRAVLLVEAMTRFLFTGGAPHDLGVIAREVAALPVLTPVGIRHLGTRICGSVEHVFADDSTGEFVRVVEGRYAERLSPAEYADYLTAVEDADLGDPDL